MYRLRGNLFVRLRVRVGDLLVCNAVFTKVNQEEKIGNELQMYSDDGDKVIKEFSSCKYR